MSTLEDFDNAVTLVTDLLIVEGRIRYLKDWEAEIVAKLDARKAEIEKRPQPISFRPQPAGEAYILRPTFVSGGKTRRFDYAAAKKAQPALYSRFVTETPPAAPVKLTFRAAGKWGGSSRTWDGLRSVGWQRMHEGWAARRAPKEHTFTSGLARDLYEIRGVHKKLDGQRTAMRTDIAQLVTPDRESLEAVTYGDGVISPSLNPPSRSVDMKAAEQHGVMSQFIKYGTRKDSIRWGFITELELYGDDEEGDQWAD